MKISLDELRALPQQRFSVSFKENLDGLDAVKPVIGDIFVSAGSTGMRLYGKVQTLLKLECDRCLRPYFQALSVDIDELFVIQDLEELSLRASQHERELNRGDFFEALPPDGVLDISDVVYQAVTLATPTSCSCGSECPGPPKPDVREEDAALTRSKKGGEAPKQIDPRWKNLKSLFPNEDSDSKS